MKERKKEMIVMKKKKEREKDSTPNTTNICTVCGKKNVWRGSHYLDNIFIVEVVFFIKYNYW